MALYIGLMSGTSADGIDAVMVDFNKNTKAQILATACYPWSNEDRATINSLCSPGPDEVHRVGMFGNRYAIAASEIVKQLLHCTGKKPENIMAIASHGQTIRHEPKNGFSVQIGNHAMLAAMTGIDVICDFRSMDIACKGQGAPLVPAFHNEICSAPGHNRFIVNIGGIANVTALIPGTKVVGFDTGPGNTLLDLMARNFLNKSHDDEGKLAAAGKVSQSLLNFYFNEPYFSQKPPKSTGRELFNNDFINRCQVLFSLKMEDRFATMTELTAISIIQGINSLGYKGEIFVCGGGIHNKFLMERITHYALQSGHDFVAPINVLGIDPDYLEALAFAWLGYKFTLREPIDMTAITGAQRPTVMGCLYPH